MSRKRSLFFPAFLLALFSMSAGLGVRAQEPTLPEPTLPEPTLPASPAPMGRAGDANAAVLDAIRSMPSGGRYAASKDAFDGLGRAVSLGLGGLHIDPRQAQPSFCSGATYLVFVQVMDRLARDGGFTLDTPALRSLLIAHQRDGQGIWGRWNANGPGTARLFTEMGLGRNFTDVSSARPGDFMKIFWTEEIGQKEHGHSVVFLGTDNVGGKEFVRFWSSNMASSNGDLSGYGSKLIPRTKIVRTIFSRLENPANIARYKVIPPVDPFLASLLSRRVTIDEVRKMCSF